MTGNYPNLPPFLINTIHKSGTHLLMQFISGIPHLAFKEFLYSEYDTPQGHFNKISGGGNNHYISGHVHYDPILDQFMKSGNLKHLFLIRDPRDILISFQYYLMKELTHTPISQYFIQNKFEKEQRLRTLIQGVQNESLNYPTFQNSINYYLGWMNVPEVLILRFEDLVRSKDSQRFQLRRILKYLFEHSLTEQQITQLIILMESANNPQKSATFRSGKIENWKHEFSEAIKQDFKNFANPLLIKMGYEKDDSW